LAADKRKILELARKLAQKNAKEKALAEYQKLLKLDPKDAKLRLEVGDAHRRWGQVEEAVETYQRVAEQYMAEGFDARAVAVYKQILNLAPDRFEAYAPLAELYERMGLNAEALSALQTAADGFHRQGKKSEALDLLRKMANADPSNTRSRIKVADLLRQEGKREDAIAEYQLAADELERQGDVEAVGGVYRRILELDERNVSALSTLAQSLAGRGKVAEAIALAERALQLDDGNTERYEHLAALFERAQKLPEHERVLRRLADLYRSRGDESRARDILQRFVDVAELTGDEALGAGIDAGAADELGGAALGVEDDDDLFGEEFPDTEGAPEIPIDFGSDLEIGPNASLSQHRPLQASTIEAEGEELLLEDVREPQAPTPSDWDQLLAEASVYLRYGKRDKAIAHLERVIDANPNHRGALEKLGEAHAENGDHALAVQIWLRAVQCAHREGDADALRVLRGRIAVLDESAAANIPSGARSEAPRVATAPVPAAAPEREELALEDDEVLDDLDLDDELSAPPSEAHPREVALDDEPGAVLDDEAGLSLGDAPDLSLGATGDASLREDPDLALDDSAGLGLGEEEEPSEEESDLLEDGFEEGESEAASAAPAGLAATPGSSGSPDSTLGAAARQAVLDQLEEADFYMQQGLHDEAEGIYRRVLAAAPNHPRAMLRLGEIASARGEAPATAESHERRGAAPDGGDTPVSEFDHEGAADLTAPESIAEESDEVEIAVDFSDEEIAAPAPAGADLDDLASLDLDGEDSGASEESSPDGSDTQELLRPAVDAPTPRRVAVASTPAADGDGGFDLAAALVDAFDDDAGTSARGAQAADDDGFAAVFQAFKKGVRETLSEGDHQAHYDLAIAYKEMGLYDDAIYELRTAMADPNRTAECLHLIGLCAIDSDQAPLAIEHLEQLLQLPRLDPDAALAGRFDLGRALEAIGDVDGARREWESVAARKPEFQNVRARLAGLGAPKPEEDEPEGAFESFSDVIEVAAVPEAEEVVVGGETFDDLVAEANSGEADTQPVIDAEALVEADPIDVDPVDDAEPEPAPEEPAPTRPARGAKPAPPRRKKKISFL
jgi:tetratricopeptide (TPR) repeat protein